MFVLSIVTLAAARVAFPGSGLVNELESAATHVEVAAENLIGRHVEVKPDGTMTTPEEVKVAEEAAPAINRGDAALDAWTHELKQEFPAPKSEPKTIGDEFVKEAQDIEKTITPSKPVELAKTVVSPESAIDASLKQLESQVGQAVPDVQVDSNEDPSQIVNDWQKKLEKFAKPVEKIAHPIALAEQLPGGLDELAAEARKDVAKQAAADKAAPTGDQIVDGETQKFTAEFPTVAPEKAPAPVVAMREESPTDIANDWTEKIEKKFGKDPKPDMFGGVAAAINENLSVQKQHLKEHEKLFDELMGAPSSLVQEKEKQLPNTEKLRSALAQDSAQVLSEAKKAEETASMWSEHAIKTGSWMMQTIESYHRGCYTLLGLAVLASGAMWRHHVNQREDASVKIQALYRGSRQRGMLSGAGVE